MAKSQKGGKEGETPPRRTLYERASDALSRAVKRSFPRIWRAFWGRPVPDTRRYEDYCETRRAAPLPKDRLGFEGERYVFSQVVLSPTRRPLACNAANYYCEMDIVFLDERTREIVFVEVKTRRKDDARFPHALYSVDAKRRKKLALAAALFVEERGYLDYALRFDVAVVFMPVDGEPRMEYCKCAFHYENALAGYAKTDFGKPRFPGDRPPT